MTLSYSLEESIRNNLFKEVRTGDYGVNVNLPHYEDNSIYSRFFEIIVPCEGTCFIPVLGMCDTLHLISCRFEQESPQPIKISYPLYVGAIDTKRTADSIIQSINRCPVRARLCNIKTSKGLDYYGGQGLIFDENWAPLMICGFIIDISKEGRTILIKHPICYVSPSVFENNDLLSKAIIKKIIPFISSRGISIPRVRIRISSPNVYYGSSDFYNIPVTIKPLGEYFHTPLFLNNKEDVSDSIWEFLSTNITDLL